MNTPSPPGPDEETAVVFNISHELEAELMRRAREKGTDTATEAADILERHAHEAGDTE